jgi:predicted transcriptional regulator
MDENTGAQIGFIMGNPQRIRIMQVLGSKGPMSSERIAKVERIPAAGVKKAMEELYSRKIVAEEGGSWILTPLGQEVEKELKKRS